MSSPTLTDLLSKIRKRREELRLEAEALDRVIETYERLASAQTAIQEKDDQQLHLWREGSRRALKSAQLLKLLDAAKLLILQERRPLGRGELVRRLEDQGHEIVGGDKNKVFGTNLWRSGRFVHVPPHGYWPKDVELPREFDSRNVERPDENL